MPSFEVSLPLAAIGLYLFDSVLLFYANEMLFVQRSGQWDFTHSSRLILFGRRVCFPNPFTPHVPQFRVRWSDHDHRREAEDRAEIDRFVVALRPLQYLVLALLLLLLALPLELIWFGTGVGLLALMAAFYLVILIALGCIYVRRRDLRISGKTFLSVAMDALACAPFAINLVRKLSMRRSLAGNPLSFSRQTFKPAVFAGLVHTICSRVGDEQQREDAHTPRWEELEAYRQELMGMLP